jgi:hypothetical protein
MRSAVAAALGAGCLSLLGCASAPPAQEALVELSLDAEERLGSLIAELETKLPAADFEALKQVQTEWEATRARTCRTESDLFFGGTVGPAAYARCVEEFTWDRIQHLRFFLCEGAGMTGDCPAAKRYERPAPEPGR